MSVVIEVKEVFVLKKGDMYYVRDDNYTPVMRNALFFGELPLACERKGHTLHKLTLTTTEEEFHCDQE